MSKTLLFLLSAMVLVGSLGHSFAQTDRVALLETDLGSIVIEFFPDDAPRHMKNFIELAESGFYDGTIFHRIIPQFVIQGGDPNTVSGDPATWGIGGPPHNVHAEFNTIEHDRGIVSMARSNDVNSAGSQFFIVHQDANNLDGQYTVFGRIATDESFETLDEIASVETNPRNAPVDPEPVRINSITIVERSDVPNILDLGEPERSDQIDTSGIQLFESEEHGISFNLPISWSIRTYNSTDEDAPDIVALGPETDTSSPMILLTIKDTEHESVEDEAIDTYSSLQDTIDKGLLEILSNQTKMLNDRQVHEIYAQTTLMNDDDPTKFKEIMTINAGKAYIMSYNNHLMGFDEDLPLFDEFVTMVSFSSDENAGDTSNSENGGCLIATAAFGSELAPQVQQLREVRDNVILTTASGTAFMSGFNQLYYSFSPTIADLQRDNPVLQELVKISIMPLLSTLSIMEYADSESTVLGFGIGVILLNLGMYVAAPAVVVYKLKKII